MVALEVSPDMTLNASPDLVNVKGNVDVPWGRIVVDKLPDSAVQVSSDVVILNNELKPMTPPSSTPLNLNANISVNIGNDVRLEAFGLKTCWWVNWMWRVTAGARALTVTSICKTVPIDHSVRIW